MLGNRRLYRLLAKVSLLVLLGACTIASRPAPIDRSQVTQTLIGRWRLQNQETSNWNWNEALIFLSDSSFIAINDGKAVRGRYWIRTDSLPMQIDLALGDPQQWFQGALELSTPTQLLLQRKLVGVSDPVRPTQIQANHAFNYQKETDQTPSTSETDTMQDQIPSVAARESSARSYVIRMLFAERSYGDREGTYATRFQQIHPGLYDEDIDYRYRIVVKGTNWIWITAQAKYPELRSFTGQVIAGNVFSCATHQPSAQPPSIIPDSSSIWRYVCDSTSSEFRS